MSQIPSHLPPASHAPPPAAPPPGASSTDPEGKSLLYALKMLAALAAGMQVNMGALIRANKLEGAITAILAFANQSPNTIGRDDIERFFSDWKYLQNPKNLAALEKQGMPLKGLQFISKILHNKNLKEIFKQIGVFKKDSGQYTKYEALYEKYKKSDPTKAAKYKKLATTWRGKAKQQRRVVEKGITTFQADKDLKDMKTILNTLGSIAETGGILPMYSLLKFEMQKGQAMASYSTQILNLFNSIKDKFWGRML